MADSRLIPAGIRDVSTLAFNELIDRIGTVPLDQLLVYLVDNVSESALPHLAEQFSVTGYDGWALAQGETDRRELIKRAIELHRRKGTPWAVKTALAAIGYPDVTITEHRENHAAWLSAGGELIDGAGYIDGGGDLAAPGGDFRFTTTQWAEYIIRPNIGDGEWSRLRQRQMVAVAAEYAPARCHLAGIITAAKYTWLLNITLSPGSSRIRSTPTHFHVPPHLEPLCGHDLIGGAYEPDMLSGGYLDGQGALTGFVAAGEPLDSGLMGLSIAVRQRLSMTAAGGDLAEQPETLDDSGLLDGRYVIAGQLLDGFGTIDGAGNLSYPSLVSPDCWLDGSSRLGCQPGIEGIWSSGLMRIRRGNDYTTEVLYG